MFARYYSSGLGRFMAVDPGDDTVLEDPQSWNKYAYVRNNPLIANDPDGKFVNMLVGAAIGAAIDIGIQLATEGEITSVGSVVASAAAGAIGVGIASKVAQIGKLAKLGKIGSKAVAEVAEVTGDAAASSLGQLAESGEVSLKEVGQDVLTGMVAGTGAQKLVGPSKAAGSLRASAKRDQKIAANGAKKGRSEKGIARRERRAAARNSEAAGIESRRAVAAGTAGSNAASSGLEKLNEERK